MDDRDLKPRSQTASQARPGRKGASRAGATGLGWLLLASGGQVFDQAGRRVGA